MALLGLLIRYNVLLLPNTAEPGFEPTSVVSRVVPDWDLLKDALPTEPQRVQGLVSPDLRSS